MGVIEPRALLCWWCVIGRCQHAEHREPKGHEMPAVAIEGGHSICAPCAAAKQALETAVRECWPLPGEEQAGG